MPEAKILGFPSAEGSGTGPADSEARQRALDTRSSCIVEAPAGSGKTGLLVQRFLKLLTEESVERPEEVMAITFTRKATAEMLQRVLAPLQAAQAKAPLEKDDAFQRVTRALAEAVLQRSAQRGWDLLRQTQRLNIQTFDAVAAQIANALPVLSGSGGQRRPIEDAWPLYRQAAGKTLRQLGGADTALSAAVRTLLLHRDGSLGNCTELIAEMLAKREQWGTLVPLSGAELDDDFLDGTLRPRLEQTLSAIVADGLERVCAHMPPPVCAELHAMASEFAQRPSLKADGPPLGVFLTAARTLEAHPDCHEHWVAVSQLMLTQSGTWRAPKLQNRHIGIELEKHERAALVAFIQRVQTEPLRAALEEVAALPPAVYPDDQWQVAKALFRVLRHALAELKLLFAEGGDCDFTELALAARQALRGDEGASDLALTAGGRLRHLLIDEMQDTSSGQYELIELLTRSWDGHSQTLFLVGDPKQSIYSFREARVDRFLQTVRSGRLGGVELEPLQLTANFRSQRALVADFNRDFAPLFLKPGEPAGVEMNVPFVAATATREATQDQGMVWHADIVERTSGDARAKTLRARRLQEARTICGIIRERLAAPLPHGRTDPWKIAVLGRSRAHLLQVIAELKAAQVPYKAVELDPLEECAEVLDALALTRALLHPADRTAWLAVLHAPWCGLGLADLLRLTGDGEEAQRTLAGLVEERRDGLSAEGKRLLARAWPVLRAAAADVGRTPVSVMVERTWRSLGGDAALGPDGLANVEQYLQVLRTLEAEDGRIHVSALEARLHSLYATPTVAQAQVELLTIHKSKGLEWDLVLVPRLEGGTQNNSALLLNWEVFEVEESAQAAILLAPIAGRGEPSTKLSQWLGSLRRKRQRSEARRLFYVAATRAKEELHLFATAEQGSNALGHGAPGSLLDTCWPAAEAKFYDETASPIEMPMAADEEAPSDLNLAAAAEVENEAAHMRKLQRLPGSFNPEARFASAQARRLDYPHALALQHAPAFERPEGSFAVRAYGNVVHRYMQLLAERLADAPAEAVRAEVTQWQPRLAASLRGEGLPPQAAGREAARASQALTMALDDAEGRWLLSPHPQAASESSLSALQQPAGAAQTLRVDRIFVAGPEPLSEGGSTVWIVDFKTTEAGSRSPESFAAAEIAKYREQLESYAALRRGAVADGLPIRLGLYYPAVPRLLHWLAEDGPGVA